MPRPCVPDHRAISLAALLPILLLPTGAMAANALDAECCRHLDESELARATEIMQEQFLYDCCDDTVLACLAEPSPCELAIRLAAEICRRVGQGQDDEAIEQALKLRSRSMIPGGPRAEIDLTDVPGIGDPAAPVVLVEYACVRCPFCSRITPDLVEAITEGPLAGKVRFHFKLFPIKGHEGSTESGLAAVAALRQERFWDFLAVTYDRFDQFSVDALPTWATEAGLDMAAYDTAMADPATRDQLVQSKREGMANGVDATPTFFISGRRYQAALELAQMIDVLEEEYERLSGAQRR
jgi:protein-disulfide isomerase